MKLLLMRLAAISLTMTAAQLHAVTPYDITNSMMPGWNLGNSLDAGTETAWGNPAVTKALVDKVKAAGFKTLRVPVSWDAFTSGSTNTISTARLDRVAAVVQYGLDDGMYVIINIHHNNGWEQPNYANEANAKKRLNDLWRQIATRFKNHNATRLIFEVMNEPRSGSDWWGTQEFFDVTNRLNAAALSTIRATGGNNTSRLVMLPTYVAGAYDHQLDAFVKPQDPMVALSVHAYLPFDFSMTYPGTKTFSDTATLDALFSRLNTKFHSKGTPVVMGEWASTNKDNYAERVKHAEYYVRAAKKYNIPVIWWDNGNRAVNSAEAMALINRDTNTWIYPEIVTAIMRGAGTSGSTSSASSSSRASSSTSSSASGAPALSGTGDYPVGFSKCADEGGTCVVAKGSGWAAYGRKGHWIAKYVGTGKSIACTAAAFGGNPGGNPNKCSSQN